jgi:hypothetical protein
MTREGFVMRIIDNEPFTDDEVKEQCSCWTHPFEPTDIPIGPLMLLWNKLLERTQP